MMEEKEQLWEVEDGRLYTQSMGGLARLQISGLIDSWKASEGCDGEAPMT